MQLMELLAYAQQARDISGPQVFHTCLYIQIGKKIYPVERVKFDTLTESTTWKTVEVMILENVQDQFMEIAEDEPKESLQQEASDGRGDGGSSGGDTAPGASSPTTVSLDGGRGARQQSKIILT
jgi:hypothetical protein